MLSSVGKNITRLVEIFENERYSPLSGWSAKGLLLTDRKALSNHDGTDGYSNIEEANGALLSRGWEWDQEGWKVDTVLSDVDADGWSYRTDFTGFSQASTTIQTPNTESTETAIPPAPMRSSSISSAGTTGGGSAQKGFFHVVRRRRLIRQQFFSAHLIDPNFKNNAGQFTCDHCDLAEVQRLAYFLLVKLAEASVKKHPRHLTERKFYVLKNEFVDFLLSLRGKDIYGPYSADAYSSIAQGYSVADNCQDVLASASAATAEAVANATSNAAALAIATSEEGLSNEILIASTDATPSPSPSSSAPSSPHPEATKVNYPSDDGAITTSTMERDRAPSTAADAVMTYRPELIDAVLEKEFLGQQGSLLSMASSVLTSSKPSQLIQERMLQFAQQDMFFMEEEREEIARHFIRCYDVSHLFHCDKPNCSTGCIFRVEMCEHNPCQVLYSYVHKGKHDAICPEKIIPCDRICGEDMRRKELRNHLANTCILRPVQCPFYCIGCHVDLLAKDLDDHVQANTTPHMLLSLQRMKEYESVLSKVHHRVTELEHTVVNQRTEIAGLTTALAASTTALAIAEKRLEKSMKDGDQAVERKCTNHANQISADVKAEVNRVKASVAQVNMSIAPLLARK